MQNRKEIRLKNTKNKRMEPISIAYIVLAIL